MLVVGGECLIDLVESEDSHGKQIFLALPGGSPFNVALAAGRLGLPVQFLSRLSDDEFGRRLSAALVESKVGVSLCPVTDQPSTLAMAGLDPENRGARYTFYTEGTAGVGLVEEEIPAELADKVQAVHVGSFSLTMEPIAGALEALVRRETTQRVISIDPNVRTMLMHDPSAARERLQALLPLAHLIKVSDEDLEWMEPGVGPEEFADGWVQRGAALVVVTRGAEGALAVARSGRCAVPGGEVEVADTIGAGDTFMAATLAWLAENERLTREGLQNLTTGELERLLNFAVRAAGINCTRVGCDPPWREDLGEEVGDPKGTMLNG